MNKFQEIKYIKMFGERNTGTNYFKKLLQLNFRINLLSGTVGRYTKLFFFLENKFGINTECLRDFYFECTLGSNLGWKHREIDHIEFISKTRNVEKTLFLILVKNPYSYLLSLHKKPYHNLEVGNQIFRDFLLKKWPTKKRESRRRYYENPIQMWNEKCQSYLALQNKFNCCIIKYEDLVENPELVFSSISKDFNIPFDPMNFKNYFKSTKEKTKDNNFYKNKYVGEKWKKELEARDVKIINSFLNKKIMDQLGYTLI